MLAHYHTQRLNSTESLITVYLLRQQASVLGGSETWALQHHIRFHVSYPTLYILTRSISL